MSDANSSVLPERNPATRAAHRKQVLWQISLPLLVVIAVFVALAVLATFMSGERTSAWADIALIWLLLPILLFALLGILVTGGLAYGVLRLIGVLPGYFWRLQAAFNRLNSAVRRASDRAVAPAIKAAGARAALRALRRR